MKGKMEDYRTLIAGFMGAMFGWLDPISGDVFALIYVFSLNFLFGYLSDMIVNHQQFSFKKAFNCIIQAAVIFMLVFSVYALGRMKQQPEAAIQCVSTVVYLVIYFYATNILRNTKSFLKTGTPAYKVVDCLYFLLSFEIVKKIPVLGEYLENGSNTTTDAMVATDSEKGE